LIHDHQACIKMTDTQTDVHWLFPLKGVAEGAAPGSKQRRSISCAARSHWEQELSIHLDGLIQGPLPQPETFFLGLECSPAHERFLNRVLTLNLAQPTIYDGTAPLLIQAIFEPLRPANFEAFLVVNKQSGGRWKFPLAIEATEPEVDDLIRIEAIINTTASVAFSITNQFPVSAKFTASFTPESPLEFKIHPKNGILEPSTSVSADGTQFVVSFTPREYGKMLMGKLVIQTDDVQWTYEVRGTHPRYVAPRGASNLDTVLSESVRDKMDHTRTKHVNYITANMKAAKR